MSDNLLCVQCGYPREMHWREDTGGVPNAHDFQPFHAAPLASTDPQQIPETPLHWRCNRCGQIVRGKETEAHSCNASWTFVSEAKLAALASTDPTPPDAHDDDEDWGHEDCEVCEAARRRKAEEPQAEIARLSAELSRLRAEHADLVKDRDRLDWLEARGGFQVSRYKAGRRAEWVEIEQTNVSLAQGSTLREAIDAAVAARVAESERTEGP